MRGQATNSQTRLAPPHFIYACLQLFAKVRIRQSLYCDEGKGRN